VGCAISASLAGAGIAAISLFDVNTACCEALAQRLRDNYPQIDVRTGSNDPVGNDLVVNATPLGMNEGDPLPLDVSRLSPDTFVGEVVMRAETTAFLAAAKLLWRATLGITSSQQRTRERILCAITMHILPADVIAQHVCFPANTGASEADALLSRGMRRRMACRI
jgi:hypothetical protein